MSSRQSDLIGDTRVAKELNYHLVQSSFPTYVYRQVYPENGGSRNIVVTSGGETQDVFFDVPAEVCNLGESYLDYSMTIPAQAAYSWLFKDVDGEINELDFRDNGSQYLVRLTNVQNAQEVLTRKGQTYAETQFQDAKLGMSMSNAPLTDVRSVRFDNTTNSIAFVEPQNFIVSSNATAIVLYKKIYLKKFRETFFEYAKNMLFPNLMYLRIQFIGNKTGFANTSNTNPAAAASGLQTGTVNGLTGAVIIQNLMLKLAVEQNQMLVNGWKAKLNGGLSMPIPWLKVHKLNILGTSTSFAFNQRLSRAEHGQHIRKIIFSIFGPTETNSNLAYDHSNYDAGGTAGLKITAYETEIDNHKLQRDNINANQNSGDDYMIHRKQLANTMNMNQNIYSFYWHHCDSFILNDNIKDGYITVEGLEMVKDMMYTFNAVTSINNGSSNNIYLLVCGQKTLSLSPQGVLVS